MSKSSFVLLLTIIAAAGPARGSSRYEIRTCDSQESGFTTIEKSSHVFKVVDGHQIEADFYRGKGNGFKPAIVWIHGGALVFGSKSDISDWHLRKYVDEGFSVIAINYRLAPETKLPSILRDVEDAFGWVYDKAESLGIDRRKIGVVGHSAGGYLALTAGFRVEPRPRAIVAFYGYGEISGSWYTQPASPYTEGPKISESEAYGSVGTESISDAPFDPEVRFPFYVYLRQNGFWPKVLSGGRDPEWEREWFHQYEPIHNVTAEYPPTLLLHGEKDLDVPYGNAVTMDSILWRQAVPRALISNPNWGHGFDAAMEEPEVQAAQNDVISFLKFHLKVSD